MIVFHRILHRVRNSSDRSCKEIKTHTFMFNNVFLNIMPFMRMWINTVAPNSPLLRSYSPISLLAFLSDNLSTPLYPLLLFPNFLRPLSSWILLYCSKPSFFLGFLRGVLSLIFLFIFLVVTLQPNRTLST